MTNRKTAWIAPGSSDYELVDEAEEAIWRIKSCRVPLDARYPDTDKSIEDSAERSRQQEEARQRAMEPRARAVGSMLTRLRQLSDSGLDRLLYRFVENPCAPQRQNLVHRALWPEATSFRRLERCHYGCDECCDDVLADLARIRRGLDRQRVQKPDLSAWLTTDEVARDLGVNRSTVCRMIRREDLRAVRVGRRRAYRIDPKSVSRQKLLSRTREERDEAVGEAEQLRDLAK